MVDVTALSGQELGGWLLGATVGAGADGIVYAATKGSDSAAVKIFFPDILEKNGLDEGLQRLDLQLQLIGGKRHANLVEVYEGGFLPDWKTIYLAMELVPGSSLDKLIGRLPPEEIPSLLHQLASASQFLEANGLVHRDIKPANVVISDDFKKLTLLDLGIVLKHPERDDDRLSGDEFVATTRYSPPEFVWRSEDGSDENAWRAITFYQIGATLHDMIMGRPLFDGNDKPRARLYDAVRLLPPTIESDKCEKWLPDLAKCCLVKNWRERLQLVQWESFSGANNGARNVEHLIRLVKLQQIRAEEQRNYDAAQALNFARDIKNRKAQELWDLQNKVFLDIRQFLISSTIFPKFSGVQSANGEYRYVLNFTFDADPKLLFQESVTVLVEFSAEQDYEVAFSLKVDARTSGGREVFAGSWIEMLTVEKASSIIQQSLLEVANDVISNQ